MTTRTLMNLAIASALLAVAIPLVHAEDSPPPAPLSILDASNHPDLPQALGVGASGTTVLQVQVRLDRARFSPGEIDAALGSNTRDALAAYQAKHGLEASGAIDAATWTALAADPLPVLTTYTITEADVAGPFVTLPADAMEKAKLPALGYASSAEALGERFHISPDLLQQLNPDRDLGRAGSEIIVPHVADQAPLASAARLVVDRSESSLSLFDAAGVLMARFPASTGSEHDPLPAGDWLVQGIARNPVFNYNPDLFWDANPAHGKATLAAGPNNPVGVVWIDLSKEHYGIHGTPTPANIAKTESHGCIRLTNWDATLVAAAVATGTPAILQD